MSNRYLVLLAIVALFSACDDGGSDTQPDTGVTDTGTTPDSTTPGPDVSPDVSASDTATAPDTTSPVDTSGPPADFDEGPRELVNGTPVRFGHVVDGDTLDVFVGVFAVRVYTIRLKGLAAPECFKDNVLTEMFGRRNQCVNDNEYFGLASWEALRDAVAGKEGWVTCDDVAVGEWCPTDDFDRYLAYIEVDGEDISTKMAFDGNGLSYTSFAASKRAEICLAEFDAQDNRRGMWANGTTSGVLGLMSTQTQNWYNSHHDSRCAEAIASQ